VHRGTVIEDAGYKRGTSWPFVPDLKDAIDAEKYERRLLLVALPLAALTYFIASASGATVVVAGGLAFVVAAGAGLLALRFRKMTHRLITNCKMVKMVAGLADAEVEHTAKVIFGAVRQPANKEIVAPINDGFGVYVNTGFKDQSDNRSESPYIIFIRKVDEPKAEAVEATTEAA
jgi:hypothetical protein